MCVKINSAGMTLNSLNRSCASAHCVAHTYFAFLHSSSWDSFGGHDMMQSEKTGPGESAAI